VASATTEVGRPLGTLGDGEAGTGAGAESFKPGATEIFPFPLAIAVTKAP
jgi:hypothetical protein